MMTSISVPTITRSSVEDARSHYQQCNRKIDCLIKQIETCDRTSVEKIQALNTQLEQAGSEALAAMQAWDEAIAAMASCY